ncbi:hypothetical protein EG329_001894 [Mollisiaceae sp. DMI_Dod_QoI]|nr:hypothetical protein EG329_001894 [Helotiales sp. DMI_Dod_QoI]
MSPNRSRGSQNDRKKKESRTSSSFTKQFPSSTTNQAGGFKSSSRLELTCGESSLANTHAWTSMSCTNSMLVYSNLRSTNLDQNPQPHDQLVQEYVTQAIPGISNHGIDISPYFQQAIENQNGSGYLYSTVVEIINFPERSQEQSSSAPQQAQWSSAYVAKDKSLHGDLAGIGAQFDS